MRVYTASNRRDEVIMVTVFLGTDNCRWTEASFATHVTPISRKQAAGWFRYWRRCGWEIRRII